jgi:aminoglycoside phosphotransferase family enzyme
MIQGRTTAELPISEKLRRLCEPSAYAPPPPRVDLVETHMSYVFLAGERVYKLKKPVRFAFLDFSTIAAREADCREELRLNRRLAPGVYLDVVPLTLSATHDLSLRGEGAVVEWLVEMRRLPAELMLDRLIAEGRLEPDRIDALAGTLANFYARVGRTTMPPSDYVARFFREHEETRRVLRSMCEPEVSRSMARDLDREPSGSLDPDHIAALLDRLESLLVAAAPALEARVRAGHVVDGHGDLRPEHICFSEPIAIFDCLEFNHDLRQVDPLDELAFLDIECALLGAPDFGPRLISATAARLGAAPPPALVSLYGACRAALRARLALAHLRDPHPRQREKWEPLAARYLRLAEERMAGLA